MSISSSIFLIFCGQYENRTRVSSLRYPVWLHSIALTDLPINLIAHLFVVLTGLEPVTFHVSGGRSNQLSYRTVFWRDKSSIITTFHSFPPFSRQFGGKGFVVTVGIEPTLYLRTHLIRVVPKPSSPVTIFTSIFQFHSKYTFCLHLERLFFCKHLLSKLQTLSTLPRIFEAPRLALSYLHRSQQVRQLLPTCVIASMECKC